MSDHTSDQSNYKSGKELGVLAGYWNPPNTVNVESKRELNWEVGRGALSSRWAALQLAHSSWTILKAHLDSQCYFYYLFYRKFIHTLSSHDRAQTIKVSIFMIYVVILLKLKVPSSVTVPDIDASISQETVLMVCSQSLKWNDFT